MLVIGVPQFLGEHLEGRTEIRRILDSGFVDNIGARYIEVEPDGKQDSNPVVATNTALARVIQSNPGDMPVVLASDCVSALGMVKGLSERYPEIGVIWYDAHGDFNTPETTPSGFLGGMPLAALVGRGNQHLLEALDLEPLPEDHVLITDVRDLDPEEAEQLLNSQVHVFPSVTDLNTAPLPHYPVYIHLDVDVIDPVYMPALGYPAPQGPSPADVEQTLRRIAREADVVGVLVSLWNEDKAMNDLPLNNTLRMIYGLIDQLNEK